MMIRTSNNLCRVILDAYPTPVFIVDEDLRIQEVNRAAADFRTPEAFELLGLKTGDAFHCLNAMASEDGCGHTEACEECLIRKSVHSAFLQQGVARKRTRVTWGKGEEARDYHLFITTVPFEFEGRSLALLILEDFTEWMELKRLIPICAGCKKIRTESDLWQQLEAYFKTQMDLEFSHGLCPDCVKEYMKELDHPEAS